MVDVSNLRYKYLTIKVFIQEGRGVGHGSRILYLDSCDGLMLKAYTSAGKKVTLKVKNVDLQGVLDDAGAPLDFRVEGNVLKLKGHTGAFDAICPWGSKIPVDGINYVEDDRLQNGEDFID